MVGSVVKDADLLQSMPKSLVAKVLRIVPQMIETGKRSDKWNITEDVKDAIRQVSSAHIRGIKLEDQLGQISYVWGRPYARGSKALARLMSTEGVGYFRSLSKSLPETPERINRASPPCSEKRIR